MGLIYIKSARSVKGLSIFRAGATLKIPREQGRLLFDELTRDVNAFSRFVNADQMIARRSRVPRRCGNRYRRPASHNRAASDRDIYCIVIVDMRKR